MAVTKEPDRTRKKLLEMLEEESAAGVLGRLDALAVETGEAVHADLLRLLTHNSFSGDAAREIWSGVEVHRATLKRRLGRDVGPRVALFDYLANVEKRLVNPTIVEMEDFERTERAAITDHLTGLFNRAHFDASLRREINRCVRYGQTASLVMLDLDDFKQVNDRHGHPVGDAALQEVGRLLGQRVRDIDIAARYGGEEFAMILPETPRMSAWGVAERIRSEIEKVFRRRRAERAAIALTISGGVASYPDDATSVEALVRSADEALYRAKKRGKNRVDIFYAEKRSASRVDVASQDIRVRVDGAGSGACKAINISEAGLLLESSAPLRLGESLALRVAIDPEKELSLAGEVVRLEERLAGRHRKVYDAGIRFARAIPPGLSRFLRDASA